MKILICGVGGRMGREVARLALDGMRGATPVAGFDLLPVDTREFPTYTEWSAVAETPDCIIDFSHHVGTAAMLEYAVEKQIPVSANSGLRAGMEAACAEKGYRLYTPPLSLCGDNGAMIAAQGYYELLAGHTAGADLNAVASLPITAE